jgi:hypothetical protein
MAMLAWPRSSWTYFGWTLRPRSSVAHVWRRSWKRMRGRLARFSSAAKDRLRRFVGLMGVPTSLAKTSPWSPVEVS